MICCLSVWSFSKGLDQSGGARGIVMHSLLRRDLDELVITAQEVRPCYASSGPLSSPPDVYARNSASPIQSKCAPGNSQPLSTPATL